MIRLSSTDYVNLTERNRGVAAWATISRERESKRNLILGLAANPREISLPGSLEICAYWPRLHVSFRFPPLRRNLIVIQVFASSSHGAFSKWLPNFSRLQKAIDSTFPRIFFFYIRIFSSSFRSTKSFYETFCLWIFP